MGYNYESSCYLNIHALSRTNGNSTLLYDLCKKWPFDLLLDLKEDDGDLFPVPVRILNFKSGDKYVNLPQIQRYSNENEFVMRSNRFFRRFFLLDTTSGRQNGVNQIVRIPTRINIW